MLNFTKMPIRRAPAAAIRRPIFPRCSRRENISFSVGRRRQQISARAAARLEFKKFLIKKKISRNIIQFWNRPKLTSSAHDNFEYIRIYLEEKFGVPKLRSHRSSNILYY
jgi:hypothetical protein